MIMMMSAHSSHGRIKLAACLLSMLLVVPSQVTLYADAFLISTRTLVHWQQQHNTFRIHEKPTTSTTTSLAMAKRVKTKTKKKSAGPGGGMKGFGGAPSSADGITIETDRSKDALAFYDYLEKGTAGDNLVRCGLGYFPITDGFKLRGVVAMRDIRKGEAIIDIPYELAVNLGQEGADPTMPAMSFLRDYCEVLSSDTATSSNVGAARLQRETYYRMLPPFLSADCLGSTDFFRNEALEALQSPLIVEETLARRQRTKSRFDIEEDLPAWIDGSSLTEEHLRWAVWIITSRVLTVEGAEDEGKSYRLLIPFLDMCNHDRTSTHILSGRAAAGGRLKIIAGSNVKAGEQINICYGGGNAGNDRFIQDYGFLDGSDKARAFTMVAQQLMGKRRILEGAGQGRLMAESVRQETLELLRSTSIEQDETSASEDLKQDMQEAINYRLGVKKALAQLGGL